VNLTQGQQIGSYQNVLSAQFVVPSDALGRRDIRLLTLNAPGPHANRSSSCSRAITPNGGPSMTIRASRRFCARWMRPH